MTAQAIDEGPTQVAHRMSRLTLVALAVVLLGCTLRVWGFLGGRSLWTDEATLALSIVYLPIERLSGQLMFDQLAPIGWLYLQRALFDLWNDFDYSLRLTSLVFGGGALLAFWRLARDALNRDEALIAIGLFAFAPPLIQYSVMLKPYILDAFFSVALTLIALRLLNGTSRWGLWTLALGVVGLAGVSLAFGAVIVLASVGLLLVAKAVLDRNYRWLALLAVVGGACVATFAATHFLVYARHTAVIDNMTNVYWTEAFAPLIPRSLGGVAWYPHAIERLMTFLLTSNTPILAMIVLLAGAVSLGRGRPWLLALCLGPIAAGIVISGLRAYPFEGRFILYLAPQICILTAAGIMLIARQFRWRGVAAGLLCLVVFVPNLSRVARETLKSPPLAIEEIEPNIAMAASKAAPGDTVFLSVSAEVPWLLYAPQYSLGARAYVVGHDYRVAVNCAYADVEALRSRPGASWIISYHAVGADTEGAWFLLQMLRDIADLKLVNRRPGSSLYRFEPRPGPVVVLPKPDPACSKPRRGANFLDQIASANRVGKTRID